MANPLRRTLVIVEDHHAEGELRRALTMLGDRGAPAAVLTSDALFAMRLRHEGIDARLTIDGLSRETVIARDQIALDGVAAAFETSRDTRLLACLEYTLIPAFMRAVRNVTALDDQLAGLDVERLVLAGTGPLVDAARLVAIRRAVIIESIGGDLLQRAVQGFARLRAGTATRWVNTDFRALVLEPGFLLLLFLKGLWQRLTSPAHPDPSPDALIVSGDRFTADVVEQLRGQSQPIILAGATQPGRALFNHVPGLRPIEAFSEPIDILRGLEAAFGASADAVALARDSTRQQPFTVAGIPYWPLVKRSVALHSIAWLPLLRHLQLLTARVARAAPASQLLVSADVTAYSRVLIETARRCGIRSTGIQHGMTAEANGHSVAHVDTLATWGEATERWYCALAPQTARFVVTGNPRFDPIAARPMRLPRTAPRAPFTIVICTGFVSDFSVAASEHENLLMIDAVLAWADSRDEVRVIHKMHPGEEPEYYAAAARALAWDPVKLTMIREPILYDLLEKADLLVAAYSSTVLESLALGTPAVVFDAIAQRRLLPLDQLSGVTISYSIDDLNLQLEVRRTAPPVDPRTLRASVELREYISTLDGKAAERVAALVGRPD